MFVCANLSSSLCWLVFLFFNLVPLSAHSCRAFGCVDICCQCVCVASCGRPFSGSGCVVLVFIVCDRSTSPPGGNQVDGLPPALGDS